MPGTICSIASCKSNALKAKKKGEQISFHKFPDDVHIRSQWIEKCQRGKEFSAKYKRICSKHFQDEDYEDALQAKLLNFLPRKLRKTAIPRLNVGTSEPQTIPSPSEKEIQDEILQKQALIRKLLEPSEIKIEPGTSEEIAISKEENAYGNFHQIFLEAFDENEIFKKEDY